MSIVYWKDISSRCKTGIHQEVASNTNFTCSGGANFVSDLVGVPPFTIMMYTGHISGFLNDYGDNIYFNQPCDYTYEIKQEDWYVVDASFIANYYTTFSSVLSWQPTLKSMVGSVPMGVNGITPTDTQVSDPKQLGFGTTEGMPIFGSIDISYGVVPSHTHDMVGTDTTSNSFQNAEHNISLNQYSRKVQMTDDARFSSKGTEDGYTEATISEPTSYATTYYDISSSDISGVNLNNECTSTPLSQNSTNKTVSNLSSGELSTNGYKSVGVFYIIYYPVTISM
jgi:hypothetical protein